MTTQHQTKKQYPTAPRRKRITALQNHDRNQFYRDAYLSTGDDVTEQVERRLDSPFVTPMRTYDTESARQQSREASVRSARVQVGFDKIASERYGSRVPEWHEVFDLLKKMTPKRSEQPRMAAMRVVLPDRWEMDGFGDNKPVRFVESATGLVSMLRLGADARNKSAVIMRGRREVLAQVAEELAKARPSCQIYKLGDVVDNDYAMTKLWPSIETEQAPKQQKDSVWVHKEVTERSWVDIRYEDIPMPPTWTQESFENYVLALVSGRLRPNLALELYNSKQHGRTIDTDGIRVKLLLNAFQDASARSSITSLSLKAAVEFMAVRGGHISSADRLMRHAEELGLPLDSYTYNSILLGYVHKRDALYAYKLLKKMRERCFQPNAATWLLFLELVQRDAERRQIIAAMFEYDLFSHPATRRRIAAIMASQDAHAAFKSGKTFDELLNEQASRYGTDWMSEEAFNKILAEFLLYHGDIKRYQRFYDYRGAITKRFAPSCKDGIVPASTLNIVLRHRPARDDADFKSAVWAVEQLEANGHNPDTAAYAELLVTCIGSDNLEAYAVTLIYAILNRRLRYRSRNYANIVAGGKIKGRTGVWQHRAPHVLTREAAAKLRASPVASPWSITAGIEWATLSTVPGYLPAMPLSQALRQAVDTVDRPVRIYSNTENPSAEETQAMESLPDVQILLKNQKGEKKNLVLDATFQSGTMTKAWKRQAGQPLREEEALAATAI